MSNETVCEVCGRPVLRVLPKCYGPNNAECYRLGYTRALAAREAAETNYRELKNHTDGCLAIAQAALAAERVANAGLRVDLKRYGVHEGRCRAFPATSEEQIDRDCDCGLTAALSAATPLREQEQKENQEALRAASVEQTEYMVQRFLTWKLPANFAPDAGINFKPSGHPASWPIGTNLFDANQATAMVRHMLDGMPHGGEALPALEKQLADERQQVDDARQQLYETNEAHNELVSENTRIREERDAYGAENAVLRDSLQALLAALIERYHGSHSDGDVVDPFALCILCAEVVDDPDAMPVHDPARACAKAAALLTAVAIPAAAPPAAAPQEQQRAAAERWCPVGCGAHEDPGPWHERGCARWRNT